MSPDLEHGTTKPPLVLFQYIGFNRVHVRTIVDTQYQIRSDPFPFEFKRAKKENHKPLCHITSDNTEEDIQEQLRWLEMKDDNKP